MPDLFAERKKLLTELIFKYKKHVDFLSIRLELATATNIFLRGKKIETLSDSMAVGEQVRAWLTDRSR